MADIGGVGGGRPLPPGGGAAAERGAEQQGNVIGARGVTPEGQPVNLLPAPLGPPNQPAVGASVAGKVVVPDVLTGRDPSQQAAGERLRTNGAPGSATERLLGLDWRPTIVGGFPPPPGNAEALRHLSPTMRRAVFRSLLDKQRGQLAKLNRLTGRRDGQRDEREDGGGRGENEEGRGGFGAENFSPEKLDARQLARAEREVGQVVRMLETVERMLAMQDYTLSQMGTFSKG